MSHAYASSSKLSAALQIYSKKDFAISNRNVDQRCGKKQWNQHAFSIIIIYSYKMYVFDQAECEECPTYVVNTNKN